jgi:hypothetical protein
LSFNVAAGDFVHAPSNEPHVFQNTSDQDAHAGDCQARRSGELLCRAGGESHE